MIQRLFLASSLVAMLGCSRDGNTTDGSPTSTTEEFRVLEAVRTFDTARFGGRAAKDVFLDGDTLLVVSADTAGNDVLQLFASSNGDSLGSLSSWNAGTTATGFAGTVTSVTATADRIFVGTTESRVEVFRKRPLAWETTVGTGVWWGSDTTRMVHCFGMATVDSLLLVRDKSCLRAFPMTSMTLASRNKVRLHCRSKEMSTSTAHHGIAVLGSRIYVTDYGNRAIMVFERRQLAKDSMAILPADTFALPYAPLGIAVHRQELLVTGTDKTFESRNASDGALIRQYGRIEGHTFASPGAVTTSGNGFAVIEQTPGSIVLGNVRYTTMSIHP